MSKKRLIVIGWADKIRKIMPKNSLKINFEFVNKNTRKITFKIDD